MPGRLWLVLGLAACAQGPARDSQRGQDIAREDRSPRAVVHHRTHAHTSSKCKVNKKSSAACGVVGSDGGTVTAPDGTTLRVPPGAVPADTAISVDVETAAAPSGALTPLYTFGPDGLVFAEPVDITLPLPAGTTDASLYWSNASGGYDRIGGTVSGGELHGSVTHFSSGYAGPSAGPLVVDLSLVWVHYVDGNVDGYTYPDLAPYAAQFYVDTGSGLVLASPQPAVVPAGNGHYSVTLPDGTISYEVQVQDPLYGNLFYAATGDVDIGSNVNGRAAEVIAQNTTSIHVLMNGLTTWDNSVDQLWISAPETVLLWQRFPNDGGSNIDVTVSTPDDFGDNVLIQKDELDVVQMTPSADGTYTAQSAIYSTTLDQHDGTTTQVSGSLGAGVSHSAPDITVLGTQFASELGLDSSGAYTNIGYGAQSDVFSIGVADWTCAAACATYSQDQSTDATKSGIQFVTSRALTEEFISFQATAFAFVQLPGTANPTGFYAATDGSYAVGSVVEPIATPVTNVRIAGQDALGGANGFGPTPTITWNGTGDHYIVFVWELDGSSGDTTKSIVATFRPDGPSLQVPPGVLASGHTYVIRVTSENGIDLQRAPGFPWARVRWLSAPFTP